MPALQKVVAEAAHHREKHDPHHRRADRSGEEGGHLQTAGRVHQHETQAPPVASGPGKYSPTMAPITASPLAIRKPVKKKGNEYGSRSLNSDWAGVAP